VQTWNGTTVSAAIQAAQAAVLGGSVFAGPNADVMINSTCSASACRQNPDAGGGVNLHFSNAGSIAYAAGWQTSMHTPLALRFSTASLRPDRWRLRLFADDRGSNGARYPGNVYCFIATHGPRVRPDPPLADTAWPAEPVLILLPPVILRALPGPQVT